MSVKTQNVWVVVTPSRELPGQWVGHCLDLDIVSQGEGFEGAMHAVLEAVMAAASDDAENGLNPLEREPAPDEDWDQLYALMRSKDRVSLAEIPREKFDQLAIVAAQVQLHVRHPIVEPPERIPEPWMIAACNGSRASSPAPR